MSSVAAPSPPSRAVTSQTVSYFLCFTLVGLLSAALGPSLLTLAQQTGSTFAALGLLFTVDSFGSVCGSLLAGWMLGRFATHLQAAAGLAGIVVVMLVLPLLTDRSALLPAWWALGLCKTFLIVTVNTLLIRERRGTVGPYMNVADFFLGLGSLLMPVVIAQSLRSTEHLYGAYWGAATLALVLLVWIVRLLPGPTVSTEKDTDDSRGTDHVGVVGLVAAMLFFYVGAEISFSGWIPTYVSDRGITSSAADAAYFTALFWIAVTVGRLLWMPLAAKYTPERLLGASLTGCVLVFGSFPFFGSAFGGVVAGTLAFGFFMAPVFPSAFTLLEKRVTVTGKVSAICLCTASVGAMFFPWLVGQYIT